MADCADCDTSVGMTNAITGDTSHSELLKEKRKQTKPELDIDSLLLDTSDEGESEIEEGTEITLEDILKEDEEEGDGAGIDGDLADKRATSHFRLVQRSIGSSESYYKPAIITMSVEQKPAAYTSFLASETRTVLDNVGTQNHDVVSSICNKFGLSRVHDPLSIAEAKEQEILSCVDVRLVSPLQTKRRFNTQQGQAKLHESKKEIGVFEAISEKIGNQKRNQIPGVIQVKSMEVIGRQLKKNIEFQAHGPGSPTVIAIHPKFIAIGTSKGLVLIFDHFQNIRQVLGNTTDPSIDGPVTAVDVSSGSDFLVCGYQSGRLVLWDMIKGTSVKADSEAHDCSVVSLRFLKEQKPILVSVDSNGIVNRVSFNKMMGMVYVVDVDRIYDGSAGKILSSAILPPPLQSQAIHTTITEQYSVVALNSDQTTFIVALEPEIKVLYRWARPTDVNKSDPFLPSLAFGWVTFPGSSRWVAPVLARAWGKTIQFLETVFTGGASHTHARHGWPAFEEHTVVRCSHEVMAIQWLSEQIVVYLNVRDEICVYDIMSRQELEIVDITSLDLVFASYREKNARIFSNSFRVCDHILYLLGLQELMTARVQPWTQRIDSLIEQGQWTEALALALDNFEGLKAAAQKRAERDRFPLIFFRNKQNDQCLVDISHMCQTNQRTCENEDVLRHEISAHEVRWMCGDEEYTPDISKKLEDTLQKSRRSGQPVKVNVPMSVAERVADLIMEYFRLAITTALSTNSTRANLKLDLAQSHCQMLAGVCIEFCTAIDRTDLLFGEIFERFQDSENLPIFLELLEPYILCERLQSLSGSVMQAFVSHFQAQNKLDQVEQCLLHLNMEEIDLDLLVKLCRQHKLYSALIYIYNQGMQDFVTPIDILLKACSPLPQSMETSDAEESSLDRTMMEERQRRLYGYKLLLYISYTFDGKTFPRKQQMPYTELSAIRAQMYTFIFEKNVANDERIYPRVASLVAVDTKVFLDIIGRTFDDATMHFAGTPKNSSVLRYASMKSANVVHCPSRLSILLALGQVIFGSKDMEDLSSSQFTSLEYSLFFMFEARLLSAGCVDMQEYADARARHHAADEAATGNDTRIESKGLMMNSLMNFLALGPVTFAASLQSLSDSAVAVAAEADKFDRSERQQILVRLLQNLEESCYDLDSLLQSVQRSTMNRAAVILYKKMGNVSKVISAYLEDTDDTYRMDVFHYIRSEASIAASKVTNHRQQNIQDAIVHHAAELLQTDARELMLVVLNVFPSLHGSILQKYSTMGNEGVKLEFLYLKQILVPYGHEALSGDAGDEDFLREALDGAKLRIEDDHAIQERFIRLLCKFEPDHVLIYLERHDTYRLDACLKLCREFNIPNAEAYLLERTGDVTTALSLILQCLDKKLKILKPALRGQNITAHFSDALCLTTTRQASDSHASHVQNEGLLESVQEGREVTQQLEVALNMCQRNSLRNRDNQAEKLWFTLLDKLLRIQATVRQYLNNSMSLARVARSGSQAAFQVAINELIRVILERMASSISLKSILFKIVNEHGREAFGDFRITIFGMLDTYKYEENIHHTANELISGDLYEQIQQLKRSRSRSYAAPSRICAYCNVLLSKPPFGMAQLSAKHAEKWNRIIAMTLCVNGQLFHETCGKAWINGADAKTIGASKGALEKSSAKNEELQNIGGGSSSTKRANTRRYLNRAKLARNGMQQVSTHEILENLGRPKTVCVTKILVNGRQGFSLRPRDDITRGYEIVGKRTPGATPAEALLKGSIQH